MRKAANDGGFTRSFTWNSNHSFVERNIFSTKKGYYTNCRSWIIAPYIMTLFGGKVALFKMDNKLFLENVKALSSGKSEEKAKEIFAMAEKLLRVQAKGFGFADSMDVATILLKGNDETFRKEVQQIFETAANSPDPIMIVSTSGNAPSTTQMDDTESASDSIRQSMPSPGKPETKRCPFCAEEILAAAVRCKHCRSDLVVESTGSNEKSVALKPEAPLVASKSNHMSWWIAAIIAVFVVGGLYYMNMNNSKDNERTKLEYALNLAQAVEEMLIQTTTMERVAQEYSYLWRELIVGGGLYMPKGVHIQQGDISGVIAHVRATNVKDGTIPRLNENNTKIEERMKKLNNPPAEYKEVTQIVIDMYGQ